MEGEFTRHCLGFGPQIMQIIFQHVPYMADRVSKQMSGVDKMMNFSHSGSGRNNIRTPIPRSQPEAKPNI